MSTLQEKKEVCEELADEIEDIIEEHDWSAADKATLQQAALLIANVGHGIIVDEDDEGVA